MRIFRSIFILLFFLQTYSYCQKPYTPKFSDPLLDKYRWRHLEELTGKIFNRFCEAEDGTMWFGIENGVMSYDGYKWREYPIPNDKLGLEDLRSMVFYKDTLFVGGMGIQSLYKGKWSKIKHKIPDSLRFSDMQSRGVFYFRHLIVSNDAILGARNFGIYVRRNGKEHFYTNKITKDRHDTILTGLKFHEIDAFGQGIIYNCSNILDLGDNTFYAFSTSVMDGKMHFKFRITNNDGNPLEVIEENTKTDVNVGGPISSIKRSNGEVWVISESTTRGLNIFRNGEWEYFSFKDLLNDTEVSWNILELPDGSIIITSLGVIYRYHKGNWSKISSPEIPFKTNHLNAVFTKSGDLWLGDEKGEVFMIDYSDQHYTKYNGLNYQFSDEEGNAWFISDDEKVVFNKENKWFYYDESDGLPKKPQNLYKTKNGVLWCGGSHSNLLTTAYLNKNKWVKEIHDSVSWSVNYNAVIEDSEGDVWFAGAPSHKRGLHGQLGGLVKLRKEGTKVDAKKYYISRPFQYSFAPKNVNSFYTATRSGLYLLSENILQKYTENGSKVIHMLDKKLKVSAEKQMLYTRVMKTKTGTLWAATNGTGVLTYVDEKKVNTYTKKDGFASDVVIDIYPSTDTSVWVATSKGYSYFNGKYWSNNIYPDEFNIGLESGKITGNKGNIWISKFPIKWTRRVFELRKKNGGFNNFYSVKYKRDTMPPETFINFFNRKVDASGNTSIEWSGIDYKNYTPFDNLIYSYRLNKGEWSIPNSKNHTILLGLESGKYTLEVRAHDKDMNFDTTPANVSFTVAQPVYKRIWFIALILSFIITVLFLATRIIIRNKTLLHLNNSLGSANSELEKATRTKNKFFSIISHDLKSPFNTMLGYSEMLIANFDKYDISKQKQLLIRIQSVIESTFGLLENLLAWSRSQTGEINYKPLQRNLHSITESTMDLLSQAASLKLITLTNKISEDIFIYADNNMVSTVIRNLVSNAIKYTFDGGLIVAEGRIIFNNNKKYVEVSIKDNGIGISADRIHHLFDMSKNVSTRGTNKETGTGLGLMLCKEFVTKHNGEIWVESKTDVSLDEGRGTTFFFTLPCN